MNLRPMLIINLLLTAAMAGFSAWAWNQIADSASVPIHWNLEGHADGFGSKSRALMLMPALLFGVTLIMQLVPGLDPRRENMESNGKFWNAISIQIGVFLAYVHILLVLAALGRALDMTNALIPALCILFAGIGNYLGKTRSNWFGGVRTPWTMSSDYSWEKTHRAAGYMFMLSGVVTFAAWLFTGPTQAFIVLFASLTLSTLGAVVMSYIYWRIDPARR